MLDLAVDKHHAQYVLIFLPQEKYDDLKWVEENLFSSRHPSRPIHFMDYLHVTAGVTHTINYYVTPPQFMV